jgi:hypothetical protein
MSVYMFYLSHQCQSCHDSLYFGQHIEIFWKKIKFIKFIICLELVLIRIRQNDAEGHRVITTYSFQPHFFLST